MHCDIIYCKKKKGEQKGNELKKYLVFTGYAFKTLGNGSSFFKVSAAAGFHYNHTGGTFDC